MEEKADRLQKKLLEKHKKQILKNMEQSAHHQQMK